jgi:hypothetical protein
MDRYSGPGVRYKGWIISAAPVSNGAGLWRPQAVILRHDTTECA